MENEISVRRIQNMGLRKVETKLKSGPVMQRPALKNIHNKPVLLQQQSAKENNKPLPGKVNAAAYNKKTVNAKVNKENAGKENIIQPPSQKTQQGIDESMEVDAQEASMMEIQELSMAFSSQILNVKDIDVDDAKNPQLVSSYVKDIYKYLWSLEDLNPVKYNYLEGQKVTSRMRAILIDWLIQVHLRFTLCPETLYLTVAIIDRFLQVNSSVTKDSLQLVGVTAMFIASKFEEIYIPEIGDFAYITDKTFTKKDIKEMEIKMLKGLKFHVSIPLSVHFLRRNSKAGQVDAVHHTLAKYIMELTLPEYSFCHIKYSLIAAASLYLAMHLIGKPVAWDDVMVYYSNYSENQLLPVVYKMAACIIKNSTSKLQAVRSKYRSNKLMKISEINEVKPTSLRLKQYAEKAASV